MCLKKIFNKIFGWDEIVGQEIVYTNVIQQEMWHNFYNVYQTPVTTNVIKITRKNGNVEYKIKQHYAPIVKPFYDGEYSSNRAIETTAASEKDRAELWILNELGI